MVKKLLVIFLLITYMTFILALDEPTAIIGENDAEKIQENIDKYVPFDDSGNINLSGYKPIKSKAEAKITEINKWLEENASWLKVVFGMVPSFTILFAINVYLILFFLTILVFNGNEFFGFMETLSKKIDFGIINISLATILGLVVFLLLHFTKAISSIAKILADQMLFIWNKVLPTGIVVAMVVMILIVVIFIILQIYAPQVLQIIKTKREADKKIKADNKELRNRQALDTIIQKATEGA